MGVIPFSTDAKAAHPIYIAMTQLVVYISFPASPTHSLSFSLCASSAIIHHSFHTMAMSTPHHHPSPTSLLGLPTELRLQIYSYLEDVTHYHVDRLVHVPCPYSQFPQHPPWNLGSSFKYGRRCRTPDPQYPFLCAKPAFCGWYKTEDLCHSVPVPSAQEERKEFKRKSGTAALRRTCKLLYEETKNGVLSKEDGLGITVGHSYDARDMLKSMRPHELLLLVHLTIQYCPGHGHYRAGGMNQIVHYLKQSHWDLPNLKVLAIQTPQPLRKFSTYRAGDQAMGAFRPGETWYSLWFLSTLAEAFDKRAQAVDVVLEAWIVIRGKNANNQSGKEEDEMVRVRATYCRDAPNAVDGERVCAIHPSKTMEFEIERRGVVKEGGKWEGDRTWRHWVGPKWMRFWKAQGMGYAQFYLCDYFCEADDDMVHLARYCSGSYGGNGVVEGE
jgi:hypothetical protein